MMTTAVLPGHLTAHARARPGAHTDYGVGEAGAGVCCCTPGSNRVWHTNYKAALKRLDRAATFAIMMLTACTSYAVGIIS
jgi:hypothetical protein